MGMYAGFKDSKKDAIPNRSDIDRVVTLQDSVVHYRKLTDLGNNYLLCISDRPALVETRLLPVPVTCSMCLLVMRGMLGK